MAITYPLTPPTSPGFSGLTIRAVQPSAISRSGLTGATQVYLHPGSYLEADVTLPPMTRAQASEWIGFLLQLAGHAGTFWLYDRVGPTAQGIATGTPRVKGGSQTGTTLLTDGWTTSQTGIMKAGDYIQLGNFLYIVTKTTNSDGSGNATLELFPRIRTANADNTLITVSNCKGLFRLNAPGASWTIDAIKTFGLSFGAVEAVDPV